MTVEQKSDGSVIWNGQIYLSPAETVQTLPVIIGGKMTDSAWQSRAPKSNNLEVIKVTKDNLARVGRELLQRGGPAVKVFSDTIAYNHENAGQNFKVGDFLVKEYDYATGIETVRVATLEERKKYDLR